ncbi:MAG TPA: beta-L-arabinofuranosidase domain-containing protein [Candidatus Acidoferrales bacterium]|nr:beta-L-arabinofuranosidase domain-containing protein [Candidatus Acidoferrales bacterium]
MTFSRRAFLGSAAALAALAEDRVKLREFAYPQVKLTGGPLAAMHQRTKAHFLALDEDRLLKVYRQRAGMPSPGRDMGGWYDAGGFVPGHLIGQLISGLARMYANTGDPEAAAKARRLVSGYAATFEKDGNPYASPKASATWACYVLDKYQIGLLDAARLAGVDEARALLPRVIDAAIRFLPDHTFDRNGVQNPPYDEPYILPENLFQTYELTGERRFLEMAKLYLLDKEFFDPLSEGRNVLPGKHGYSHVIALSSGAKAYQALGDGKYLRAIRNAWDMIGEQQYASGAWAPKEAFVRPHSGELAASLASTRDHFETPCCFYAFAKLARYLTSFTVDSRYGDGLERALFNTILGALDPDDDGGYFYYSDYQAGARKRYYQRKWPCCAGTLFQSVADYPIDLYFHDPGGIYVNLYAASTVKWQAGDVPVKLVQTTAYPESEKIELRVEARAPADFDLHLRIPGWLDGAARLSVNGKTAPVKAERGTFATIRRRWRNGDTVELALPFSFRAVSIDEQNPDTVAVMRGPVMLTAIDPPERLEASAAALATMSPVAGNPLEFDCATAGRNVRLRPFYRVQRETYSTYIRRTGA